MAGGPVRSTVSLWTASEGCLIAMATLNVDECRAKFPSLKSGYIFADNAGGSQVRDSSSGATFH